MSDKTANQIIANGELTTWLNEDTAIQQFNVVSIKLLQDKLDAIEWDDRFAKWRDAEDGNKIYWFFIKGGTALRILFSDKGQTDIMPDPSDWDTQIVINPDIPFDLWYRAYQKIAEAINEALYLANMCFTLMPKNTTPTTTATYRPMADFIKNGLKKNYDNATGEPLAPIKLAYGGTIRYRQSGDRKTVYQCDMFHPLQSGDLSRQRFANLTTADWKAPEYQLKLVAHSEDRTPIASLAIAEKTRNDGKKKLIVVGRKSVTDRQDVLYIIIFDDKGKAIIRDEIQLISKRRESNFKDHRWDKVNEIITLISGPKLSTINSELTKQPDARDPQLAKDIEKIKRLAVAATDFTYDPIFDSMYPQETVDVNQLNYRSKPTWKKARDILKTALSSQSTAIDLHYQCVEHSLGLNEGTKAAVIQWFNSNKTALGETSDINSSETVENVMSKLPLKAAEPLASGQKTLIIDEFYLHRLVVRYKYVKPDLSDKTGPKPKSSFGKTMDDYNLAWTASGNLRGELIDVTVPRRDTFECQHHSKLLKDGTWQVSKKKSGVPGVNDIEMPLLDEAYHIEEQILITREVLAGKSSSPKKLHKRIKRGYSLGVPKNATTHRLNARKAVINVLHKQFTGTYGSYNNQDINQLISNVKAHLDIWADIDRVTRRTNQIKGLKELFDNQVANNSNLLACKYSSTKLDKLKTFVSDVRPVGDYPDVWGKGSTEQDRTNAGMIDFFIITAIYAQIAQQIEQVLKNGKVSLARAEDGRHNLRETIKFLIYQVADNNHVFMQLTGSAATYHHLKDLNQSFGEMADEHLIVEKVQIRCLYDSTIDLDGLKQHFAASKTTFSQECPGEVDIYNALVDNIEYVPLTDAQDQQTEYAYGMPVMNLNSHIKALENNIGAAEFLRSEMLKEELDMLHRALTTREYSERYRGMPKLKRTLSSSRVVGLKSTFK
ncbi:MAG: hypothetical protein HWE24_01630 [Oceanospirillaceae bacterium]|nr:hypothetical protein [Oceanospirillaceae bacterium]